MEKIAFSIDEFAKFVGIGRNKAHEIVHSSGFPAVKLGRRIIIPVIQLQEWLANQAESANGQHF